LATTRGGSVAVRLAISMGGVEVKYKIHLRKKDIELQLHSTGQRRTKLAARLLRPARASTDSLAVGRKELRIALVKAVAKAV
jgi:hypothetical protein